MFSLTCSRLISVSKTNLSVHEDKNRVPFVKVFCFVLILLPMYLAYVHSIWFIIIFGDNDCSQ